MKWWAVILLLFAGCLAATNRPTTAPVQGPTFADDPSFQQLAQQVLGLVNISKNQSIKNDLWPPAVTAIICYWIHRKTKETSYLTQKPQWEQHKKAVVECAATEQFR